MCVETPSCGFAARYLYRVLGESSAFGPWMVFTVVINSLAGHNHVIDDYNQRDEGHLIWRHEECLPTDIDFPSEPIDRELTPQEALLDA